MPVQLTCSCGKQLKVRDELAGKRIKCPACGEALLVKEQAIAARPKAKTPPVGEDDEPRPRKGRKEEDETPRRKKVPVDDEAAEDDEEEAPRPRKKSRVPDEEDEDDEDETPRRKAGKKGKGNPLYLWLGIGGGGVAVAIVVVLILVLRGGGDKTPGDLPLTEAELETKNDLMNIGIDYHVVTKSLKRTPANLMELVRGDGRIAAAMKMDRFVILWGVDRKFLEQGDHVLGYEKDVPTKGGLVLLGDTTVRKMTAAHFAGLPKASPPLAGEEPPKKLTKDPVVEAKRAAEREKKRLALQAEEKKAIPVLAKLPRDPFGPPADSVLAVLKVDILKGEILHYLALSPDGSKVAAGATKGAVHTWDLRTGKKIRVLAAHTGSDINDFTTVAFFLDGLTLATGGPDKKVKFWDLNKGEVKQTISQDQEVIALAMSPIGKTLAVGIFDQISSGSVNLVEVSTAKSKNLTGKYTLSLAFSPDGKFLAGGHVGQVTIWEVATEQNTLKEELGFGFYANGVAFSPDGWILGIASENINKFKEGGALQLLNLETGQKKVFGNLEKTRALAFSPDGKFVAACGTGSLAVWNLATGQKVYQSPAFVGGRTLAFSPGGQFLLVCDTAEIRIMDMDKVLAAGK